MVFQLSHLYQVAQKSRGRATRAMRPNLPKLAKRKIVKWLLKWCLFIQLYRFTSVDNLFSHFSNV